MVKQDSLIKQPGFVVPFGWKPFYRKHAWIHRNFGLLQAIRPASFHLLVYALGQMGWALDSFSGSAWAKCPVQSPIFILGLQRSGTTFLHRLLVSDTTHARALSFQEMIFPARSIQRFFQRLKAFDASFGGKLTCWFMDLQGKKFGPMDHIHRLRFHETEEDEFVLWAIFNSDMCVNDSPFAVVNDELDELRHFENWSAERLYGTLNWYRAVLQKKLFLSPGEEPLGRIWYVGKNPRFTQKTTQLLKIFPDAKFIYLVRNPLEAIPSRLSLLQEIWRCRFPGFQDMDTHQQRVILDDSIKTYLAAERDLPLVPENQLLTVKYSDLRQKPSEIVAMIYKHFDLPEGDANLQAELSKLAQKQGHYQSHHEYHCAHVKMEDEIRQRLAVVFDRYDF